MSELVQSAGVVLLTRSNPRSVLLLKHKHRLDLPKGHVDPGETLHQTAMRETEEETGLRSQDLVIDPDFEFVLEYEVISKKYGRYPKRATYFLGWVETMFEVELTEHKAFEWLSFPTGPLQAETIDPLFQAIEEHLAKRPAGDGSVS